MNIVVCAKQIPDISEMKIDSSSNKPILEGTPQIINDIDKNAIEEAIKIKEKNGGKITVLTVTSMDAKERVKELLAMGADEAVIVKAPENVDYYMTAHILSEAIKKIGDYDLILCGEASVDLFSGQIGPRLAGLLSIPQLTYAQKIDSDKEKISAERNTGDKIVTTESNYPALVTVTKEINDPRLPSLMEILAAANKPIKEWESSSIVDNINPLVETVDLKGVSMDRKNIVYENDLDESVEKLVDNLAKDGVLGG